MASSQNTPPFPQTRALCKQHLIQPVSNSPHQRPLSSQNNVTQLTYIPGEPSISLTQPRVQEFLTSELSTPLLDELYSRLWFAARRSGKSIDPLNRHKARGRGVIATEDVHMHLVWHHDKIHIKPIPLCLLNYDFWNTFLSKSADGLGSNDDDSKPEKVSSTPVLDREVALGFMRSYSLLVRHRLDFILAREAHLFPVEMDWLQWAEFIAHFRDIEDRDVAKRYHFGQLRLSRLNWVVRLFRPSSAKTKWFYEIPFWSTGKYVERAFAPVIFSFASVSIVLSAMQVLLSVPEDDGSFMAIDVASLLNLKRACSVFSIMVLFVLLLLWIFMLIIPVSALLWQFLWGYQDNRKIESQLLKHTKRKDAGPV